MLKAFSIISPKCSAGREVVSLFLDELAAGSTAQIVCSACLAEIGAYIAVNLVP